MQQKIYNQNTLQYFNFGFLGSPIDFMLVEKQDNYKNSQICTLCNEIANETLHGFEAGYSNEIIADLVGNLCTTADTFSYEICYGTAITALV